MDEYREVIIHTKLKIKCGMIRNTPLFYEEWLTDNFNATELSETDIKARIDAHILECLQENNIAKEDVEVVEQVRGG